MSSVLKTSNNLFWHLCPGEAQRMDGHAPERMKTASCQMDPSELGRGPQWQW